MIKKEEESVSTRPVAFVAGNKDISTSDSPLHIPRNLSDVRPVVDSLHFYSCLCVPHCTPPPTNRCSIGNRRHQAAKIVPLRRLQRYSPSFLFFRPGSSLYYDRHASCESLGFSCLGLYHGWNCPADETKIIRV